MGKNKKRSRKWLRFIGKLLMLAVSVSALLTASLMRVDAVVESVGTRGIVAASDAGHADCILVLGAQVRSDGSVSPMLADRLETALVLYRAGVSDRILVSGDHGTEYYDEVNAMRNYLLERGVPSGHVFMDHAGFDTYDSLYRARDVFEVRSCVVVTQGFHLKRALFIAGEIGLDARGVDAALGVYGREGYYRFREVFARTKAWLECRVLDARPAFLGPVIPITGDGNVTVDRPVG
ncbi:MAG: YdcF family protein [Clostridia bacterium]|nr:YdcF family protein [Clostridia bacterium]